MVPLSRVFNGKIAAFWHLLFFGSIQSHSFVRICIQRTIGMYSSKFTAARFPLTGGETWDITSVGKDKRTAHSTTTETSFIAAVISNCVDDRHLLQPASRRSPAQSIFFLSVCTTLPLEVDCTPERAAEIATMTAHAILPLHWPLFPLVTF